MDQVDIEVLLAYVLKKDRSWVVAHPEAELNQAQRSLFRDFVRRRASGEPAAYLQGEKEFYGRTFNVDRRVLIPRPSTEGLIDFFLKIHTSQHPNNTFQMSKLDSGIVGIFLPDVGVVREPPVVRNVARMSPSAHVGAYCVRPKYGADQEIRATWRGWPHPRMLWRGWPHPRIVRRAVHERPLQAIVDIGTGSGCIAVTLACEVPRVKVIATDVCSDALDVAKENARRHGVLNRIEFRKGSLLEPIQDLREPFFVISNPPYVPSSGVCNTPLQEPAIALYAGPRGTDVLLPLMQQAREHPYCQGIVVECREDQVEVSRVGT